MRKVYTKEQLAYVADCLEYLADGGHPMDISARDFDDSDDGLCLAVDNIHPNGVWSPTPNAAPSLGDIVGYVVEDWDGFSGSRLFPVQDMGTLDDDEVTLEGSATARAAAAYCNTDGDGKWGDNDYADERRDLAAFVAARIREWTA